MAVCEAICNRDDSDFLYCRSTIFGYSVVCMVHNCGDCCRRRNSVIYCVVSATIAMQVERLKWESLRLL